jgi:hypothetical protein
MTVLYGFKGCPDGARPAATLVFDKADRAGATVWGYCKTADSIDILFLVVININSPVLISGPVNPNRRRRTGRARRTHCT